MTVDISANVCLKAALQDGFQLGVSIVRKTLSSLMGKKE
jgi:hypothetical protein